MEVKILFDIIIAFPKIESAKSIKNILNQNGILVAGLASTGAQAIDLAEGLEGGLVISGYRFLDMHCHELREYLPRSFGLLLLVSQRRLSELEGDMEVLGMPLKTHELLDRIEAMEAEYQRKRKKEREKPKLRSEKDKLTIQKAKLLLMEKKQMSEEEAHRYIQKLSMDGGKDKAETAGMLLDIMKKGNEENDV